MTRPLAAHTRSIAKQTLLGVVAMLALVLGASRGFSPSSTAVIAPDDTTAVIAPDDTTAVIAPDDTAVVVPECRARRRLVDINILYFDTVGPRRILGVPFGVRF